MFERDDKIPSGKLVAVQYAILGVFLVLGFGLWRLQVLGAAKFATLAEQNRVHRVPILAPRGRIYDREGRIVVDNYPSVSCFLLPDQVRDPQVEFPLIARGLGVPVEQIETTLRRHTGARKSDPIPLKDDITPDEQAFIEAHRNELPELETVDVQRRLYPRDGFAAHLIGYVGEVSEEMLNQPQYELYEPGDVVGKSGVEQQYNDLLMGRDGSQNVVVDSHGREVGRLDSTPAVPGRSLKLTIDLDIQKAAEAAIEGRNGAVVALDPRTGEILAMVSRPTFDPNAFAVRISRKEWNDLVTDPAKPLLNKAIQAQLAPGSVFKIIMSVAGMQEGIAQNLRVNCPGGGVFYGRYFKCWVASEHRTHGIVDISKAIYQSCDTYFYTLAERLGIGKIAAYAHAFGLGQKTGVDLPQEVTGVMPSEEWKLKLFRQKWFPGETISVGIGQGAVAATPIQLARAIGGIAMDGHLKRPHIVAWDDMPEPYRPADRGDVDVPIDPRNWEVITDAMSLVTDTPGTAPSAHLEGIDFAGKTGSAQVVSNAARSRLSGKAYRDNSWFAGVTPRRNPEIVVCVLFEGGEHGKLAGRLAAQVISAYVEKQRRRDNNLHEVVAQKPQPATGEALTLPPETGAPQAKPAADKDRAGAHAAAAKAGAASAEMVGLWHTARAEGRRAEDEHELEGGRFAVPAGAGAAGTEAGATAGAGGKGSLTPRGSAGRNTTGVRSPAKPEMPSVTAAPRPGGVAGARIDRASNGGAAARATAEALR